MYECVKFGSNDVNSERWNDEMKEKELKLKSAVRPRKKRMKK